MDRATGVVVLLKRVRPGVADPERRRRFLDEARLGAGIDHPNVVRVLHVDAEGEALVAEWVEGTDLRSWLDASGPLPPTLAVYVARGAARGLAAVHAAGVLHRDVSAANVLLGHDGSVKLTDFGFASLAPDPGADEVRGTLGTLAPEVVLGEPPTAASDLFSLGAVLVHALTGRAPFEGASPSATLDAVVHADAAAVLEADPRVPAAVAALAGTLLARDPQARPASATATAERLADLQPEVGAAEASDLAAYLADPAAYRPPVPVRPSANERTPDDPEAGVPSALARRRWGAVALAFGLVLVGAVALTRLPEAVPGPTVAAEPPATAPLEIAGSESQESPSASSDAASGSGAPELSASSDASARAAGPLPETPSPAPSDPRAGSPDGAAEPDLARPVPDPLAEIQAGTLVLAVEPWARVRVAGREVGTTPLGAVSLPAGDHEVVLTNPDFPVHTVRVRVEAGEETRAAVSLWDLVGRVALAVSPWARVTVDGDPWDTVPPQDRPLVLRPGDHVLGFAHPTLGTREVRLRIAAGEERTVRVRMDEPGG